MENLANIEEFISTPYGIKKWSVIKRALDSNDALVTACEIALKLIAKAEADRVYKRCVNPHCGERGYKFIEQVLIDAKKK